MILLYACVFHVDELIILTNVCFLCSQEDLLVWATFFATVLFVTVYLF